jgi:hypothetical protein
VGENEVNERGERLIWLEPNVVNRLAMRGPGESYSDVILRLAAAIRSAAPLRAALLRNQPLHSAIEFALILAKK